jgi:hypothetical protein
MLRLVLLGSLALSGAALLAMTVGTTSEQGQAAAPSRGPAADPVEVAKMQAYRSGGVRAAAALTGTFVFDAQTGKNYPTSLSDLCRASDVILIGRPVSNVGRASRSGTAVLTAYTVSVEGTLKGSVSRSAGGPGSVIIEMLGGRVGFPDGSWAQENVPTADKPATGEKYLFFLTRVSPASGFYNGDTDFAVTFGAATGVYGLADDARGTQALDRLSYGPARVYRGKSSAEFLHDVRLAIQQEGGARH